MCSGKISVVIPYYNGKRFIREAVESIVKQPYKNVEILLINDGSTDTDDSECRELIDMYSNILYFQKPNEGIGATRNFGIEHATGEYIAFLDQDDVWAKNFLDEHTVKKIFNGGDAVCFSHYCCNGDFSRGSGVFVKDTIVKGGGLKAMKSAWQHHSSIFFKRSILLDNDIRCPHTRHEDEIFRHKYMYITQNITLINKVMFLYRNNSMSETHRKQEVEKLYVPLLESWVGLLNWFEDNYPDDNKAIEFVRHMLCVYAIEGVEAMYMNGYSNEKVENFVNQSVFDYLKDYDKNVLDDHQRERIKLFFTDKKKFAKKNRIAGFKIKLGYIAMKIPFVKSMFYKRKYPSEISRDLLY